MLGLLEAWWEWIALLSLSLSLSRGAATPETDVTEAELASVSLAERAEREERLLLDL